LNSDNIQDGGGRSLEILLYGHVLTNIAYIRTEFDAEAKIEVREVVSPSTFTPVNPRRQRPPF